jgi:hypothetical protein
MRWRLKKWHQAQKLTDEQSVSTIQSPSVHTHRLLESISENHSQVGTAGHLADHDLRIMAVAGVADEEARDIQDQIHDLDQTPIIVTDSYIRLWRQQCIGVNKTIALTFQHEDLISVVCTSIFSITHKKEHRNIGYALEKFHYLNTY